MTSTRTKMIALPVVGALLLGAGQLTGPSAAAHSAAAVKDGPPTTCSTDVLKGRYILSGGGTIAGDEFDAIVSFVLDGKGTITEGFGTVGLHRVAVAQDLTFKEGTYSVGENCTGTLRFFAAHDNKLLEPVDHVHKTKIMVFDGGRQFAMLNLSTEQPGETNNMSEAFRFIAHRV